MAFMSWIFMLLALLVSSLLLTTANGKELYENPEMKGVNGDKRPFFVGSRYGRSHSDLINMDENGKTMNLNSLGPRNDRFFFGSRYGKRSLPVFGVDEDQNRSMTCFYTGVANLFRCVEKIDSLLNPSGEDK